MQSLTCNEIHYYLNAVKICYILLVHEPDTKYILGGFMVILKSYSWKMYDPQILAIDYIPSIHG